MRVCSNNRLSLFLVFLRGVFQSIISDGVLQNLHHDLATRKYNNRLSLAIDYEFSIYSHIKLQHFFAEYSLFYRALPQKRPTFPMVSSGIQIISLYDYLIKIDFLVSLEIQSIIHTDNRVIYITSHISTQIRILHTYKALTSTFTYTHAYIYIYVCIHIYILYTPTATYI